MASESAHPAVEYTKLGRIISKDNTCYLEALLVALFHENCQGISDLFLSTKRDIELSEEQQSLLNDLFDYFLIVKCDIRSGITTSIDGIRLALSTWRNDHPRTSEPMHQGAFDDANLTMQYLLDMCQTREMCKTSVLEEYISTDDMGMGEKFVPYSGDISSEQSKENFLCKYVYSGSENDIPVTTREVVAADYEYLSDGVRTSDNTYFWRKRSVTWSDFLYFELSGKFNDSKKFTSFHISDIIIPSQFVITHTKNKKSERLMRLVSIVCYLNYHYTTLISDSNSLWYEYDGIRQNSTQKLGNGSYIEMLQYLRRKIPTAYIYIPVEKPDKTQIAKTQIYEATESEISQMRELDKSDKNRIFKLTPHYQSIQGKRSQMEDVHQIENSQNRRISQDLVAVYPSAMQKDISFYGIYDGHGGKLVADQLLSNLFGNIINSDYFKRGLVCKAIADGYVRTNVMILEDQRLYEIGSTAVTVLVMGNNFYCANLGDAECVVAFHHPPGTDVRFEVPTIRHNTNNPEEQTRLLNLQKLRSEEFDDCVAEIDRLRALATRTMAGNELNQYKSKLEEVQKKRQLLERDPPVLPEPKSYIFGQLAVTRSFGDNFIRDIDPRALLNAVPNVSFWRCDDENAADRTDFIILSCDGLWEGGLTYSDAVKYVEKNKSRPNVAADLVQMALERGSTDNITCIVVFVE